MKECSLCEGDEPIHPNSCECVCHIGEGQQKPTSQWNLTDMEVLNLMDDEKSDSV